MFSIKPCTLPDHALLSKYTQLGAYTDCYGTEITGSVTHAQYVSAFYTTLLFKLERIILKWAISKPSSDIQASQLADGSIDTFAAWCVEDRCDDQLLLSDFQGRTRSWLMVETITTDDEKKTRLYFGSAVIPLKEVGTRRVTLGFGFSILLGFHKIYSELLLYSAKLRLSKHLTGDS